MRHLSASRDRIAPVAMRCVRKRRVRRRARCSRRTCRTVWLHGTEVGNTSRWWLPWGRRASHATAFDAFIGRACACRRVTGEHLREITEFAARIRIHAAAYNDQRVARFGQELRFRTIRSPRRACRSQTDLTGRARWRATLHDRAASWRVSPPSVAAAARAQNVPRRCACVCSRRDSRARRRGTPRCSRALSLSRSSSNAPATAPRHTSASVVVGGASKKNAPRVPPVGRAALVRRPGGRRERSARSRSGSRSAAAPQRCDASDAKRLHIGNLAIRRVATARESQRQPSPGRRRPRAELRRFASRGTDAAAAICDGTTRSADRARFSAGNGARVVPRRDELAAATTRRRAACSRARRGRRAVVHERAARVAPPPARRPSARTSRARPRCCARRRLPGYFDWPQVWSNTNMVRVRLDIVARLEAAGPDAQLRLDRRARRRRAQGYPKGVASMPAFFDELERAGFNTVHGVWRDRVTADGSLQATDPRLSLFDQFPVTCSLRVVGKIMARHYDIPVTDGKHTVTPAGHRVARIWDRATHGAPGDARCPCGTSSGSTALSSGSTPRSRWRAARPGASTSRAPRSSRTSRSTTKLRPRDSLPAARVLRFRGQARA